LAMPEGMTVPAADDALILHPYETTTHILPVDGTVFVMGQIVAQAGQSPHDDKKVVLIPPTLPPGSGKFKTLQIIDDLTPGTIGWDFVKMH
jgi:hypothetical protein